MLKKILCVDEGFSLIEIAIALTVMGIVAGVALPTLTHMLQGGRLKTTTLHQEAIFTALSHYALRNGELPLPAATEIDGVAQDKPSDINASHLVGYVPYVTLGISPHYALDGFQQPIVYAITYTSGDLPVYNHLSQNVFNPTETNTQANMVLDAEKFCHKHPDDVLALLNITDQNQLPVFTSVEVTSDDFIAVVLLSRGEEAGRTNPSETELINTAKNLQFKHYPYATRKDIPHRHILKWVSRDFLIGHYGQLSCPTLRHRRRLNNQFLDNNHSNHFDPSNLSNDHRDHNQGL